MGGPRRCPLVTRTTPADLSAAAAGFRVHRWSSMLSGVIGNDQAALEVSSPDSVSHVDRIETRRVS